MQTKQMDFQEGFQIALGNDNAQAAKLVLGTGKSTGGSDNRHPDTDQWLFVVSGEGEAVVNDERLHLEAGTLLLIERNEAHEIRNTGQEPLRTFNIYVPPAYG